MPTERVAANVVIAAQRFNPSIFTQLWLVRKGIVDEEGFGSGCIVSDDLSKIETKRFGLLVIPSQLQFVPRGKFDDEADWVREKVGKIVRLLPETPYLGIGSNFEWLVWPDDDDAFRLAKRLFCPLGRPPFDEFQADDATFGASMSQDELGCRLNLDVKPIEVHRNRDGANLVERRLRFTFNFHLEVSGDQGDSVQRIEEHLGRWADAHARSEKIVTRVSQWEVEHD